MKFLELNLLSRKPVNVVFKSKKKAASQYESIPFLAVSASDSNDKIVVLTVQSHGIYLFNVTFCPPPPPLPFFPLVLIK